VLVTVPVMVCLVITPPARPSGARPSRYEGIKRSAAASGGVFRNNKFFEEKGRALKISG
jgi:hypothetical protein